MLTPMPTSALLPPIHWALHFDLCVWAVVVWYGGRALKGVSIHACMLVVQPPQRVLSPGQ
jgi:hypothetical protein